MTTSRKEELFKLKHLEVKESTEKSIKSILIGVENINTEVSPLDIKVKIKDEIIIWASLDVTNQYKVNIKYSYDKIYLTDNVDDEKFELYRNIFNAFDLLRKDNIKNVVSKILEENIFIFHEYIFSGIF